MDVPQIDVTELAEALAQGAVLLDVREPDEWAEAHVPGVPLIPLGELADRLADVPAADPLYVICRSGARSNRACEFLIANGRNAVNVAGGTLAWIEAGEPVETGAA